MTQAAPPDSHVTADIDRPDHGPKARWRRSALRSCSGKARAVALVAVLTPVFNRQMESFVSNGWLQDETGLDLRSVQFGLRDLVTSGQIQVEVRGPKRTIRAIVPTAPEVPKGVQDIHGKPEQIVPGKREQNVHANSLAYHECFSTKARIKHSPIVGSRLPLPPQTELARSVALASARDATPFRPGEFPAWMDDDASPPIRMSFRPSGAAADAAGDFFEEGSLLPSVSPSCRGATSAPSLGQSEELERCKLDDGAGIESVETEFLPAASAAAPEAPDNTLSAEEMAERERDHVDSDGVIIPRNFLARLGAGDIEEGRRVADHVPAGRLSKLLDRSSKFGVSSCGAEIDAARKQALATIERRASA